MCNGTPVAIVSQPNREMLNFLKHNEKSKKYLEDIAILRLLLIFLLIWNHAFAPFADHWDAVALQTDVQAYKWMVLIVYHMRIQALIFISGYLLGYISQRKPDALTFNNCVLKKVKRLILPSIVFSVIYFAIFYDISMPLNKIAYSIINGAGHMWFLPMLFWCFVAVYLAEKLKISPILIAIIASLAAIMPCPTLPLRINNFFCYFIYFYVGFGLNRGYLNYLKPRKSISPILTCGLIYVSAFTIKYILLKDDYIGILDSSGGG